MYNTVHHRGIVVSKSQSPAQFIIPDIRLWDKECGFVGGDFIVICPVIRATHTEDIILACQPLFTQPVWF